MICCSYTFKCQVLFRLCTGMKRKQEKEQQKSDFRHVSLLPLGLLFLWDRARLLASLSTLLQHSCLPRKRDFVPVLRGQLPQVPPGRAHPCSPHTPKASVTFCNCAYLQGNSSTLTNQWKSQIFNNMYKVLVLNPAGQEKLQREIFKHLTEETPRLG